MPDDDPRYGRLFSKAFAVNPSMKRGIFMAAAYGPSSPRPVVIRHVLGTLPLEVKNGNTSAGKK
jgi:hypothetical protein